VAFVVAAQVILGWYVSCVRPQVRDAEYGAIITGLKARIAELPGQPIVVMLGSSRAAGVFRPSALLPPAPGGPRPVVFNCSTVASGPIRELQIFRRLLSDGVRPDWLFVEVWSPFLMQRDRWFEERFIRERDLQLVDWPVLSYCREHKWRTCREWLERQLSPAVAVREQLLQETLPDLLPPRGPQKDAWLDPARRHQEDGWLDPPPPPPELKMSAFADLCWKLRMRQLCDPFEVYPPADRALRELLALARKNGTAPCLLLCPDHSSARGPAGMDTWSANAAYLEELSRDYAAPIIDTRDWAPDEEITDYIHATRTAAVAYTRRFGKDVLRPLLAGERLPPVMLGGPSPPSPPGAVPLQ
jgi:hypothetical protein